MTTEEAWRNLSELARIKSASEEDLSHIWDVAEKLKEKQYQDRIKKK